jgi:hypothetical protein
MDIPKKYQNNKKYVDPKKPEMKLNIFLLFHASISSKCVHNKVQNNQCPQCLYSLSGFKDLSRHIIVCTTQSRTTNAHTVLYSLSDSGDLSRHIKCVYNKEKK